MHVEPLPAGLVDNRDPEATELQLQLLKAALWEQPERLTGRAGASGATLLHHTAHHCSPPPHSHWKDSGSVSGFYCTPVPERKPSIVANTSQQTRKARGAKVHR